MAARRIRRPSGYYGVVAHNFNVGWNQTNGLLGLGARLYDPQTGRFINRDPIGYAGGMNLYGYADDDPVDEGDPTGDIAGVATFPGFFGGAGAIGGGEAAGAAVGVGGFLIGGGYAAFDLANYIRTGG